MRREYHAIVVGAGPAGCAAAYDLASAGYSVLLLDRRRFPRVKPCAGALTIKAVKALRYPITPVIREVATDFAAGRGLDEVNVLHGSRPICVLTVRSEFDFYCLQRTIEAGTEFRAVSDWKTIEQSPSSLSISTSDGIFQAQFLVGADGANSQVRRVCPDSRWGFSGFAIEVDCAYPNSKVNLEFDFGVVDGGYGWLFPKRDHVNVGLFTYKPGRALSRVALETYRRQKLGTPVIGPVRGHNIGLGGFAYQPSGRVLLAGDAAGFVDALLGEGISNALRSGQAAAAAIRDELERGSSAAAQYAWRLAEIQSDVAACYRAAVKFYDNLDVGYSALISPVIRWAAMKGYALGLTFSETKKRFLLLPLVPVREAGALTVSRPGGRP